MRKSLIAVALATALAACGPTAENTQITELSASAQQQSETARLNQWFESKYEEQLQQSPLQLTFLGRKEQYDQIDDMSEAAAEKRLAWLAASVTELKNQFNYELLEAEAKTSYDIWIFQYEEQKTAAAFHKNRYIFNQMYGPQSYLPQILISYHQVDSEADMQAYIKRITGISQAITELLAQTKRNVEYGVRAPRFAYEGVIEQVTNLISGAPFTDAETDSPLWADSKSKVAALQQKNLITPEQAEELLAQTQEALSMHFLPAYQNVKSWFEADISNTAEIATGVGGQPNGEAYYNAQIKASTTTSLTAEQIHQIGLNEVERLTKEMIAIKDKTGFDGDLQQFFAFIQTDPQFFYPDTDEGRQGYIDDSISYLDFINQKLPEYFGILPKAKLEVKRVEAFREQPGAAQHYSPGTADGSRPGVYYAHLSDMKAMPKNEMEAIAYHEGNPGHHMQISIAQELTSIPVFRTQTGFTAYVEGWGLYAELLAKEMGAYQNPYSDFGRLITEMWRAVRLVVDTGLHAKGWTEQQAIDYFREKTPVSAGAVTSEVRRYIAWPGQATAYKIGMLKIIELRQQAEKELGDKFDIRSFHDTVLGGGALPLDILERRINTWINQQKN